MLQLRLFGTVHIENYEGAKEDLDEFAKGVDALFIEEPGSQEASWPRILLRNPGIVFGVVVYSFIKGVFQVYRNGVQSSLERELATSYSNETGVPYYSVDINRAQAFSDVKGRITLLSWPSAILSITGIFLAVIFLSRMMIIDFIVTGVLFMVVALLPFHFTVKALDERRNEHMLDRVLRISEREGYEDVCLIAGDDHREKVSELAEEQGIEVPDERKRDVKKATLGRE